MTHLDGPGDNQVQGPGDGPEVIATEIGPEVIATEIAGAVERLSDLWSVAIQGAVLRLSLHQLRALRVLETAPGLNLTGLAEWLDIGMPTASRLCDRLEAAGLLDRAYHPRRRREVQLSLTAAGRHVLEDVAGRRARALALTLAVMEPADRAALRRGLRAFLRALDVTSTSSRSDAPGRG
ncbi:MarR family transcriptional regulator [Streptomyces phaeoluteigriseus]|uniref:MarR family transcriptional regulator n=1 Tax=Streptomyces phaeoluteigriseus TaxID=114686 RepID=A0ABY4Z7M8_9ACTN|nr:MarR family transcriptional regulator [Streptomyces phaeoluteigriseus]USQ84690.1 MarR family transcriptional regulator [Streptomyces phaeoluteigriseus]